MAKSRLIKINIADNKVKLIKMHVLANLGLAVEGYMQRYTFGWTYCTNVKLSCDSSSKRRFMTSEGLYFSSHLNTWECKLISYCGVLNKAIAHPVTTHASHDPSMEWQVLKAITRAMSVYAPRQLEQLRKSFMWGVRYESIRASKLRGLTDIISRRIAAVLLDSKYLQIITPCELYQLLIDTKK